MNVELTIPKEVRDTVRILEDAGFEAYLVGGCVRDLFIGRSPKDWDITTNAKPDEIVSLYKETFYENDFGTVGVVLEGDVDPTMKVIEITPYRLEGKYSDGRHPDQVIWSDKLEEDLKRRDFTINALALKIIDEKKSEVIDLHGGIKDLSDKIIRTVGNPKERFREDGLRILRAIRIAADLDFLIDKKTESAIKECADLLDKISEERIRDEFVRIIQSERPMLGILMAKRTDVLKHFLPEIIEGFGCEQNQAHSYDVFEHSLRTLDHSAKKEFDLEVRLASLFHDIGKPATRRFSKEKKEFTFYGHDVVGARMTEKILKRLKFPKKTIENVVKLVRWHMFFSDTEQITLSAVRRMIRNVGEENIWKLMDVRTCDRIGTGRPKESPYRLRKYHSMVEEAMRNPISVSTLKINGEKLMNIADLKPGPRVGQILHILLDEALDDAKKNSEEYLEKRGKELSSIPEDDLKKLFLKAKEKKEEEEEKAIKEIRSKHFVE